MVETDQWAVLTYLVYYVNKSLSVASSKTPSNIGHLRV